MSPTRIPPRPREDWDAEVLDALAVLKPPGDRAPAEEQRAAADRPVPNILGIFSWHPALTKAFLVFNNHLFRSTLTERVREMAVVRVGWLRRGEYEWAQHVALARKAGLTDAEIDAISEGPGSPVWGAEDAALLQAVDELVDRRDLSDGSWVALSRRFDRQQLMDLVFTVGSYDMLAMAFNTFGLQLDPGLEGFPPGATRETTTSTEDG